MSSAIDALDLRLDSIVSPLRGNPAADAVAFGASALGDHGLIWFLFGVARARKPGPHRGTALWAVAFSGLVTPAVNAAVKRAVGRRRPDPKSDDPPSVRVPRTTSFPSGHALAAWCAATLLADGDPLAPVYYLVAGTVSVSRVHLRLHHATDVLAGAVLGIGLGHLGRRMRPLPRPSAP
jgi:undecaprenyl-diphosphatase